MNMVPIIYLQTSIPVSDAYDLNNDVSTVTNGHLTTKDNCNTCPDPPSFNDTGEVTDSKQSDTVVMGYANAAFEQQ